MPKRNVVHVEIPAAHIRAAADFYKERVHPKTEISQTDRFAAFKNPTGNVLALYMSINPK